MSRKLEASDCPFGEPDSESEYHRLKDEFSKHYFEETEFNRPALFERTYLIVGRRGSGKTALNHYFEFQREIKNCRAIDVDEPSVFQRVMRSVEDMPHLSRDVRIAGIVKIWEYSIWGLIFECLRDRHADIQKAYLKIDRASGLGKFLRKVLELVTTRLLKVESREFLDCLDELLGEPIVEAARVATLREAKNTPVIVSIDSLEQYDIRDELLMDVIAGLVQCAALFNRHHASTGLHVKVFLSGEVYPFLFQDFLTNSLKYARSPVYLVWRNKDLMRLVCWKFYKFLERSGHLLAESEREVDWGNHRDVYNAVWEPSFGEYVENGLGRKERTFPYLMRHTHMRPRQVILLCNYIAQNAIKRRRFPRFDATDIRKGLERAELDLAREVINSYSQIYPGAGDIVDVLTGIDSIFEAKLLDRRAPQSRPHWRSGEYSSQEFRRMLTQLGIVGRVRHESCGYVSVDFEYSIQDPLKIDPKDTCAIHPMFYGRLNAKPVETNIVYPFLAQEESDEKTDTIFVGDPG